MAGEQRGVMLTVSGYQRQRAMVSRVGNER